MEGDTPRVRKTGIELLTFRPGHLRQITLFSDSKKDINGYYFVHWNPVPSFGGVTSFNPRSVSARCFIFHLFLLIRKQVQGAYIIPSNRTDSKKKSNANISKMHASDPETPTPFHLCSFIWKMEMG